MAVEGLCYFQVINTIVISPFPKLNFPGSSSYERDFHIAIITVTGIYLFFYGLLSSFATSYGWILFLRFLVGFSIGCVPQSVTLFAEFLPIKQRAKCVVLMDCFWAFGACLEVLLAALIMTSGGWRWLLALSSLPSLVFVIAATSWLPESARYNAASGNSEAALETLERIAQTNGKPMLLGRLIVDDNIHLFSR